MATSSSAYSRPRSPLLLLLLIMSSIVGMVRSDLAKDKAECATLLIGMGMCLAYVNGRAKTPTPDCCNSLNDVYTTDRKCLCLLIKDRDEPDLGITFNASLALSLPSACHNTAVNITECPTLLNLPPGSKDAEIFLQYGKDQGSSTTAGGVGATDSNATSTPATKSGDVEGNSATSTPATKSTDASGVGEKKMMRFGVDMASGASTSHLLFLLIAFLVLGG